MLDQRSLIDSLLGGIEIGLRKSLEEIQTEAQRRAPVRKLFKGGGRRRITGAIGVNNQTVTGKPYFMARRVGRTLEGEYLRSAPNSSAPMSKLRIGGAEFREVQREPGYNVAFRLTHQDHPQVGREILARAKSDIRRGRGLNVLPGGKAGVEYGGKLRDSIEVIGPRRTPLPGVIGYVRASAVEHGFNYAYAQEFGTAHNAPQPYLRPALRSMQKKIAVQQRDAIRARLSTQPARVRVVPSNLELLTTPGPSFKLAGRGSVLKQFDNRINRALR